MGVFESVICLQIVWFIIQIKLRVIWSLKVVLKCMQLEDIFQAKNIWPPIWKLYILRIFLQFWKSETGILKKMRAQFLW